MSLVGSIRNDPVPIFRFFLWGQKWRTIWQPLGLLDLYTNLEHNLQRCWKPKSDEQACARESVQQPSQLCFQASLVTNRLQNLGASSWLLLEPGEKSEITYSKSAQVPERHRGTTAGKRLKAARGAKPT